jgi:hypothetical protein
MLHRTDEELKRILWTDETMVKVFPNGEAVFYRSRQELPDIVTPIVQQGGAGQMLWGCMSFYGYGPLEAVEGFINGQSYLTMLRDVVRPELDFSREAGRVLIYQNVEVFRCGAEKYFDEN